MLSRSAAITLLVLALAACNDASSGPQPTAARRAAPEASPPPEVRTVTPQYRTRMNALETSGKVQFNEEHLVRVQAPVTGRVVEVFARPGDAVEPGHRMLTLDSPDLGAAKADYAKAVADVERSEKALGLARELYEAKAAAQKEVREAQNDHRKSVAERDRAASRLRTLGLTDEKLQQVADRADTDTRVTVTARAGGVIVERNVNAGQVVAYGQSDTPPNLFVIADLSTMWVLADVYEPDIGQVRVGQSMSITLPCCPDQRYDGRITYIGDAVDKETRTIKVRAVVPNPRRTLKAEMFVKVRIGTSATRVLSLAQGAVHRESGETFVLVDQGHGDYVRRRVKVGADFDGAVEILDGVTPDDRVVVSGGILLKKGAK